MPIYERKSRFRTSRNSQDRELGQWIQELPLRERGIAVAVVLELRKIDCNTIVRSPIGPENRLVIIIVF